MDKQFSTIVLVVVVGVLLGVGYVVKQNNDSMIKDVLRNQTLILTGIDKSSGGEGSSSRILELEKRITVLETQVKFFIDLSKQGLAAGGDAAQPQKPAPPSEDMNKVYDIPIDHSPVLGDKNAPVMIVEYVDFQCPFCSRFHGPVLDVLKMYPGKVSYMIKHFPLSFHPQAAPASRAALAAGEQGKFFEMANAILADNKNLSDDRFKELAKELKLDEKKFWKDYTEKAAQYDEIIKKDMQLGSQIDVRGTPTYYINGKKTVARDVNSYKREVDAILGNK